jgi:nucleotide-binding universal stress UspA family protein
MYERILIAIDGSKVGDRGLEEGIRMASSTKASVRLLHVLTSVGADGYVPIANHAVVSYENLIDELRTAGRKVLDDATARALQSGVICETKLVQTVDGGAAKTIVKEARDWPADLIVMGTHGRRGLRRLALGSDAETVLRTAPVPVLLVRDLAKPAGRTAAYAKVLVPVDGSDASKRGLREAARIASASRATLRLLHVVNELIVGPEYLPLLRYEGFLASLREEANAILSDASVAAREAGATCETVVLETLGEEAAQSIVRQAQEWGADLIVMGTHGRRGLRRLALGSDAETVLRHSPAPLLLVRGSSDDD